MSQTQPSAESEPSAPRPGPRGGLWTSLGLAAALFGFGFATRELQRFAPRTSLNVTLSGEVEEFFFQPSDGSPLLVLVLCGWLLWRRRARLAPLWGCSGHPALTGALWAAAVGIFVWSVRIEAPELQALALIPALLGALHLLGGLAALRVAALPAAILLFALPVPAPLLNEVLWTLQIATADFTGFLLRSMGFAAYVSGDQIIMSDGLFQIIETCSGIRAIETLAILSFLMVDLFERRGWHALLVVAASLPVAFLINGLRCVGLIFNPHSDVASIHSLQGIGMLLGGVLLLYFFDGLLERLRGLRTRDAGVAPSALERRARREAAPRWSLGPRIAALVALAGVFAAASLLPAAETDPPILPRVGELVPLELAGWNGSHARSDWVFLGRAGFREPTHRSYARSGQQVDLFLGQARPRDRLRSYFTPKIAYPGSGWRVESEERVELVGGRRATLRLLRKGPRRLLVAHWFERSTGLAGESLRALLGLDLVGEVRQPLPVAVRLTTEVEKGRRGEFSLEAARSRLEAFLSDLDPALQDLTSLGESA